MTAATLPAKPIPLDYASKGAISFKGACIDPEREVYLFIANGVPGGGTSGIGAGWAGPGSLCVGVDTGGGTFKLYINTNTKASPTWTVVGSQS